MADIPPGMVFDPSGVEILSLYLPMLIANGGNVVAGLGQYSELIKVSNVYSCKPWFFFRDDEPDAFGRDQRFVFSCREKIARKNSNGKRPRREVHGSEGGGFWKSSTGEKPVADEHGRVLGFLNVLNFYEYHGHNNDYKKKNRTDDQFNKTSWIMYEYRLNGERFQEWVICKIKKTCRKKREATGAATEDDDLVREIEELASSPDED